jgi:basic membrane protein A and related proteins
MNDPTMKSTASRRAILKGAGLAVVSAAIGTPAFARTKPVSAALVSSVPLEQQWISRIHKALKVAEAHGDVTYVYSENVANNDGERVLKLYAEQGKDLIVGDAFGFERGARKIAQDYPKSAFLIGSSFKEQAPNFSVFDNYIQDASYLTGIVAGKATKSNIIGMVGGYAIPEVNRLMHAFLAGALSVNPKVKVMVTFINSWYDPPKAKEAAFAMIDKGADIMYAERFGVSDAAKERGVKAIGNVIDTAAQYPGTVIASALWHFEPSIDKAVKGLLTDTYKAEDYGPLSIMTVGGCSIAPLDPKLVPQDVIDLVAAKERDIKSGAFKVAINDAEPKQTL